MKNFDARSFAAASTFPMKILTNEKLILSCLRKKQVLPIHLQLNPTNKCNFSCAFCSCSSRDKALELSLEKILDFLTVFRDLGGESTTITGGGDPILHKDIGRMIEKIVEMGIKIGIVCNGSLWHRVSRKFEGITWVRVSSSDILSKQLGSMGRDLAWWLNEQHDMVKSYPEIDWAFSHVVSMKPAFDFIAHLVDFANSHNFTHVRLVSDILQGEHLSGSMAAVRQHIQKKGIDDSLVNYQDRASYSKGTKPCYISLLKPVLAADGFIYPCCGVQYALSNPSRDYEKSMKFGSMNDFELLIKEQRFFDGSVCVKCYYSYYNDALNTLLNGLKHKEFI